MLFFYKKNDSKCLVFFQGPYLEDHFPVAGQEFQNYVCSSFSVADISDHSGLHVHCGRSIAARYVYIRQQENNNLTLCEVYVYDEPNGMYI